MCKNLKTSLYGKKSTCGGLIYLIPIMLVLSPASITYGYLLGDWENDMDDWSNANAGAQISYSTTGATLNEYSLRISAPGNWTNAIIYDIISNNMIDEFRDSRKISVDITRPASEWMGSGAYCEIFLCVNAGGNGWSLWQNIEQTAPWSPAQGDEPINFTYDYTIAVPQIDLDNLTYLQLFFCTNYDPLYTSGVYYIDNLRMYSNLVAYNPNPEDSSPEVRIDPTLSWMPGLFADIHNVYFGSVFDDVNDVNTASLADYQDVTFANIDVSNFKPGTLEFNSTYHWRVDEVNDAHPDELWKGTVWSFTTGNFIVVDDFEDYNDTTNRIYYTWADYGVNNTGMTVGHIAPPFAEKQIVHSDYQSMYMRYDNDGTVNEGTDLEQAGTLLYSEAQRTWEAPQDWTRENAESLTLWFRGIPASVGSFSFDPAQDGTAGPPIIMTAAGADIWGTSDEFHFAYKQFSGVGSITAKVVSVSNTNSWAKAGVMLRETLSADSKYTMMVVTPGNGISFQYRSTVSGGSEEVTQAGLTAPYWVRLTRSGNTFTGEYSANGATWQILDSLTIPMFSNVYAGLALTSHNTIETCTAEFSDVVISGTVTGDWQSQDIGIESNIPEPMYIVLADSAGNSALIKNPDPAASAIGSWTEWNIPFADFTSVNPQDIKKITIGVGDEADTPLRGAGTLYIDDIRLYRPTPVQ